MRTGPRAILVAAPLLLLAGCAAEPIAEPPFEPVDVAAIVSGLGQSAPTVERAAFEEEVHEHVEERRWEEAAEGLELLARGEPDPVRRAELYYASGECWLAVGGREHDAWEVYEALLRDYSRTPRYELIVERLFLIGRRFCDGTADRPSVLLGLRVEDRKLGVAILEAFQKARERHPLADDALHHVALAQLEREEPELAIAAWQKLMDEYPLSEWADTAEYRIGLTFGLMSDGVEYDKRPLLTSLLRLRRYTERHRDGDHREEALAEVERLEEALAAHQLEVARFYQRHPHDRRYSAQLTLDELIREYPETEAASEAIRMQRSLPRTNAPAPRPEPDEPPVESEEAPPPPDALAAPAD